MIALYNVGVECEFLGRLREALTCYMKAEGVLSKHLGENEQMMATIEKAMRDCEVKISRKEAYHHLRSKSRSYKATANFFNDRHHLKNMEALKKTREGCYSSRVNEAPKSSYVNFMME